LGRPKRDFRNSEFEIIHHSNTYPTQPKAAKEQQSALLAGGRVATEVVDAARRLKYLMAVACSLGLLADDRLGYTLLAAIIATLVITSFHPLLPL
jgi:hypothetical protein